MGNLSRVLLEAKYLSHDTCRLHYQTMCTSTTVLKLVYRMEDEDILYGKFPLGLHSLGHPLFQRVSARVT